ncbi:MAG: type II secretion system GspH family protein [Sulfuricella denitrificans]|nr:type II secretion system GspH family protein [Sulfuricella denitrificans]
MTGSRLNLIPDSKPWRQQGFSLWELTVLLGILGIAIVAGFALLKADRAQQIQSERTAQLSAADRALAGFIAEKGRLPCPDTTGSGLENCGTSSQKGWLPVVTLGLNASAPARGVARLSYIVYRGAGADLTAIAADRYKPLMLPTLLNGYSTTHTFVPPNINTLDFCVGLTLASDATAGSGASAASAYIPGASGAPVNVAYALAESGIDIDGDGNLFDGLNASTTAPVLESPARASDTSYDDIVQSRSFYALGDALKCPPATRSVDAIAHAVEVGVTVTDFRIANTINAGVLALNAGVAVAMNITSVALGVAALIAGAATLTKATTALSVDTAACAACVVLVGCAACAKIPFDTSAIGFATAGLVIAASALAVGTLNLPLDFAALAAAIIVTAKAGVILAYNPTFPPEILANLKKLADDAAADADKAEQDAAAARGAANAALAAYNGNVASLYAVAGNNNLSAALDAYKTYSQAARVYHNADADAKARRKEANDMAAAAVVAEADAAANPTDADKQAGAVYLRNKATTLAAAATLAEQDAANKLTAMNTAYDNYIAVRNPILNAYPVGSQASILASLNTAVASYDNYMNKDYIATNLETAAVTARKTANDMQASYIQLRDAPTSGTSTQGGPPLPAFSGAEDILRAADMKGAVE